MSDSQLVTSDNLALNIYSKALDQSGAYFLKTFKMSRKRKTLSQTYLQAHQHVILYLTHILGMILYFMSLSLIIQLPMCKLCPGTSSF